MSLVSLPSSLCFVIADYNETDHAVRLANTCKRLTREFRNYWPRLRTFHFQHTKHCGSPPIQGIARAKAAVRFHEEQLATALESTLAQLRVASRAHLEYCPPRVPRVFEPLRPLVLQVTRALCPSVTQHLRELRLHHVENLALREMIPLLANHCPCLETWELSNLKPAATADRRPQPGSLVLLEREWSPDLFEAKTTGDVKCDGNNCQVVSVVEHRGDCRAVTEQVVPLDHLWYGPPLHSIADRYDERMSFDEYVDYCVRNGVHAVTVRRLILRNVILSHTDWLLLGAACQQCSELVIDRMRVAHWSRSVSGALLSHVIVRVPSRWWSIESLRTLRMTVLERGDVVIYSVMRNVEHLWLDFDDCADSTTASDAVATLGARLHDCAARLPHLQSLTVSLPTSWSKHLVCVASLKLSPTYSHVKLSILV